MNRLWIQSRTSLKFSLLCDVIQYIKQGGKSMTTILTPKRYLSKPGALSEAGEAVAELAKNVLIVGGKTALSKAGGALTDSLKKAGVSFAVHEHDGYPSERAAREIGQQAEELKAQAILSVGGGRIQDVGKAAAFYAGLPAISAPTIAATCASWAPTSILYNDDGAYTNALPYNEAPVLIIADTDVIAKAPVRYIRSGASDALARLYENNAALEDLGSPNSFYLRWKLKQAELIKSVLFGEGLKTINDLEAGKYDPARAREVIDVNILLTGFFVSPRNSEESRLAGGFAHPIYHTFSVLPELHKSLHGEQIAFFLIVGGLLQNVPKKEIEERLDIFHKLKQPLTLEAIGLNKNVDDRLSIAIPALLRHLDGRGGLTEKLVKDAILSADALGRELASIRPAV
jgi:glycerol dehydrogenase